jgi:hypothetical protein
MKFQLDRIIFKLLNPLLNLIPGGWKSITGVLAIVVIMILKNLNKITEDEFQQYYGWATVLFGVGILHKELNEKKPE